MVYLHQIVDIGQNVTYQANRADRMKPAIVICPAGHPFPSIVLTVEGCAADLGVRNNYVDPHKKGEAMLIRITAPHFVAGIIKEHGKPCHYAPILKWMAGWTNQAIERYCKWKGYKIEFIA